MAASTKQASDVDLKGLVTPSDDDDCRTPGNFLETEAMQVNGEAKGSDVSSGVNERSQWSKKREYILSMMGCCIGIGNIWRFPYICMRNGGGAFLIPFILSLVLFGLPLYSLEAAIGQYSASSGSHIWSVCPMMKGVGVSMFMLAALVYWVYNTFLVWSLYYLVSSFYPRLAWTRCDQWWNTENCTMLASFAHSRQSPAAAANLSAVHDFNSSSYMSHENRTSMLINTTSLPANNATDVEFVKRRYVASASEEFWQYGVLQVSGGLYEPGHVVWYLALSLLVACSVMFLGLIKGIKSSGKVVYVTVTAPYILLTALLIRGVTLPGSVDGILFYITPDFNRLADSAVWIEAAVQVFWSLGPSCGFVIALASYNKFYNDCLKDSIFLVFVCEGTSVFAGFAIFSVLGYMANEAGVPVDQVVSAGQGLAFIVYPEALSLMPLPQLWSILFFAMIVTVTVDSELAHGETVLTMLSDYFPRLLAGRRILCTAVFCGMFCVLQLPFITQGGIYLFTLVDWYLSAFTLSLIGIVECVVFGWIYGVRRFGEDIKLMTGRNPPLVMKLSWCIFTPLILVTLSVFMWVKYTPPAYGDYHYDTWAHVCGWILAVSSFVPIPVVAVYQLTKSKGSLRERLQKTLKPDEKWGPALPDKQQTIPLTISPV